MASGTNEQSAEQDRFQEVLSDLFPKQVKAPKESETISATAACAPLTATSASDEWLKPGQRIGPAGKLKAAILVKIEVPAIHAAPSCFSDDQQPGYPLSAIDISSRTTCWGLDKRPDYGIDRAFDGEWKDLIDLLPTGGAERSAPAVQHVQVPEAGGSKAAPRHALDLITIYDTLLLKRPVWLFQLRLRPREKPTRCSTPPSHGRMGRRRLQDLRRLGRAARIFDWASQVAQSRNGLREVMR